MSIKDWREKIKSSQGDLRHKFHQTYTNANLQTTVIIILVGCSSFGLGRLSAFDEMRESVTIEPPSSNRQVDVAQNILPSTQIKDTTEKTPTEGNIVASKSGTKYYFPWCSGANKIGKSNKVWFQTESEARAKGYTPASNCKGLQ